MGKKTTKRRTIWKTLPLTTGDGGSCSEDDVSTTSSGRSPGLVLRMRSDSYRHRDREPLVRLESKTFDQEEYTKITTPRQDVLFKKGYFARKKLESSIEECAYQETEGGDEPMEQMIITNGFVDERGHYLVNGNSYEIYDPYTNTVTVVVGPPPYTNGITPPVLAAVSCQPVPLQPVDWYPPGGGPQPEWHPGQAWTPAYPKPETAEEESPGSEDVPQPLFPPQPFVFQNLLYPLPIEIGDHIAEDVKDGESLPQEEKETAIKLSNTPLKPTVQEFIPSSLQRPAPPLSTILVPNNAEFIPYPQQNGTMPSNPVSSTLRPTGAVFVPRQQQLEMSQAQEAQKISQPPPQEVQQAAPPSPKAQPTRKPITNGEPTKPVPPKPNETEKAQETAPPPEKAPTHDRMPTASKESRPVTVKPEETVKELRPESASPKEQRPNQPTRSRELRPSPKNVLKVNKEMPENPPTPNHTQLNEEAANGPQEVKSPPPASPRRSYAKMLSNGLEARTPGPTEPQTDHKDNKESEKRPVQNGTILGNGFEERQVNGKESARNARNAKESKRNGHDQEAIPVSNGTSPHHLPQDKIVNGTPKKDTKEVFYNKKPAVNGHNKVRENGHINGKDRSVNNARNKVKPEKRTQIMPSNEETRSTHSDDSDTKSDSFRPVENRRNRTQMNGGTKNKSNTPLRVEIVERELIEIPAESKPAFERLDTTTSVKSESEKSSTLSELSSPTDLSSGQTTPPDTVVEPTIPDLNKSVEKLKEGLNDKRTKKSAKKNKKNNMPVQHIEPQEEKFEKVLEELPPLPDFLQPPKDDIMDLDLSAALDHALLRSLRQNEPAISKINLFPPRTPSFPLDVYSKTNFSQLRAPRPEEFFASIVDTPVPGESLRLSEKPRKSDKVAKAPVDIRAGVRKPMNTAYKPSRKQVKGETPEKEEEKPETKLGIVDAVKNWLETPEGAMATQQLTTPDLEEPDLTEEVTPETEPKNEMGNPVHAQSAEGEGRACSRVAEPSPPNPAALTARKELTPSLEDRDFTPTPDFPLGDLSNELTPESLRTEMTPEPNARSTRDSTPDLAALTDARASVDKYYNLSGRRMSLKSETSEVSEQEAVDALEYAFPRPPALAPHTAQFPTKDLTCKVQ